MMKSALNTLRKRFFSRLILPESLLRNLLRRALWFSAGMLLPLARISDLFAPFSAALPSMAPAPFLLPSLFGALLGEFVWNRGFRFLANASALLIVAAVRWTLSEWKKLTGHPVFPPVLAVL